MSLRSTLTKLTAPLSSFRLGFTWTGLAVVAGLMAVSATGCGGCDNNSLQACPADVGPGLCICDSYGCHVANPVVTGTGGSTAGTGGSGTGGTTTTACDPTKAACPCDNGTCPTGLACVNGLCIDGCNYSYECGSGKVCVNGACTAGCDTSSPCATGYTCVNGACQIDPNHPQCGPTSFCPPGEICSNGLCTSKCDATTQCASGEVCDGATGTCIPDPSTQPVCDTAHPCPSGEVCLSDGFCHYPCATLNDCKLIDNRFVACDTVCKTEQEVNPQCTLTMPCPTGKTCISNTCL